MGGGERKKGGGTDGSAYVRGRQCTPTLVPEFARRGKYKIACGIACLTRGEACTMLGGMTDAVELLQHLSQARGIAGHEGAVRRLVREELEGVCSCTRDTMGNLFCRHGVGAPRVMLTAHMDEIGFIVQHILPDGFLQLAAIGGWWGATLPSQRVTVQTMSGVEVPGVIGSKPPHFLPPEQRNAVPSPESLFVDVGAQSAEQAREEFGIQLGDPVVPDTAFTRLMNPNRVAGKAFDNRAGLACMVAATQQLAAGEHPNELIAAATVQEEVGTRGAKTAAHAVPAPDCVLVLEAPPADDTPGFARDQAQGALGAGVQVRLFDPTAITNPKLAYFVRYTAAQAGIPIQLTVRRSGGTDAAALHLAGGGVPCVVLGIPTRYIHAHNGILDLRDYRAAIDLCVELVKRLDAETIAGFGAD